MATFGNALALVGFLAVVAGVVGLLGSVVPKLRRRRYWTRNSLLLASLGFIGFLIGAPLATSESAKTVTEVVEPATPGPVETTAPEPTPIAEPEPPPVAQEQAEPEIVSIRITSDPSGAEVFVQSIPKGRTPLTVSIPANERRALRVDAPKTGDIDLYKPYFGSLNFSSDNDVSVWLERTSAEDQQVQRTAYNASFLNNAKGSVEQVCRRLVKDNLKAPSTAQFAGWYSEETAYTFDGASGKAEYYSVVDAQNSFGAMLRNSFMCSYDMTSDTVKLEFLE